MRTVATLLTLSLLGLAGPALAEDSSGPGRGRPPRPPQEAFQACASLKAGESCTVQLPDQGVTGTCEAGPDQRLFCRPEGAPPPPQGDRPRE